MQDFVLKDHSRFETTDHGAVMRNREQLLKNRQLAREANEESVVVRYIQFMLAQQQYARMREAEARSDMQENSDAPPFTWWFETEGRKFICFYLWLAQFEAREINVSEMAYHLAKSREFCSRTLTAARNHGILNEDNTLPEEMDESIKMRVLTFIRSKPSLAFVRTSMVQTMMKSALVFDSDMGRDLIRQHDEAAQDHMSMADMESIFSDILTVGQADEK